MKDFEYYKTNKYKYPTWSHKCSCEKSMMQKTEKDSKFCQYCGDKLYEQYLVAVYKDDMKKYNSGQIRLHEEFKSDCFEEFGLKDHPNKDNIFGYAWMKGHSGGFNDVYSVLSDMDEYNLFKIYK